MREHVGQEQVGAASERIRLAAVQFRWCPEDYASGEAFARRVTDLCLRAVEGAPGPTLIAFPELIGLPLLATAGGVAELLPRGLFAAVGQMARQRWPAWLTLALRRRWNPVSAAYADLAPEAHRLYQLAFSAAARASGATVVAGSAFLPTVSQEAARGLHVVDPRPRNQAYVFAANGALLARSAKAYLTDGLERRIGLVPGRVEDLTVVPSPVGRLAVAVCLDAFYHHVVERLDGLGCQVLVQPSANDASWDRPWPAHRQRSEGDAWLGLGLRAVVQQRAQIRYGLNPMLVGEMAPLSPQGRSSVVGPATDPLAATGADLAGLADVPGPMPELGLLAIAPDATNEAIVIADLPHPARA